MIQIYPMYDRTSLTRAVVRLLPPMLALAAGGCATALAPPTPEAPFFEQAGQAQIAASTLSHLVQISGAWSPLDGLGLIVMGSPSIPSSDSKPRYQRFVGAMAGWYLPPVSDLRLELYAGAERGWTAEYWWADGNNSWYMPNALGDTTYSIIRGSYLRYMAQVNVGTARFRSDRDMKPKSLLGPGARMELGLILNASYVRFDHLEATDSITPARPAGTGPAPLARREAFFIDPSLLLRFGGQGKMLELLLGTAHTGREVDFRWNAFHLSIGLRLRLGPGGGL